MDSGVNVEMGSGDFDLSFPTAAFEDSNAMGDALLHFWTQNLQTDVDFRVKCGDQWMLFSAHKLILCLWSPELADMLSENSDRKVENAIKVTDVLPSVFEAMLKFMYGSKAELHSRRKDVNFILKLCNAAVKYQVEALRVTCCEILTCTTLTTSNVFDVLEASRIIGSDIMRQRCYKILQSQTGKVLAAQELSNVTPAMIQTILNFPRVSFKSEYELAVWIFAWAKNKCVDSGRDFRSILFEVLPFVKLTSLSAEEFGKLLQNHVDSVSEGDAFRIFMNIAVPGSRPLPEWCVAAQKIKRQYDYVG